MLYFIPTPIWNLDDITLRALKLFKELKIFFCEDTRIFKWLLTKYEIDYTDKQFFSITSYTNKWKLNFYTKLIEENDVWVVSEAWSPWLSDPWKELVRIAWENDFKFEVLPWANALVPSVVSACFDTSKFLYLWFLPQKKGRQTMLKFILEQDLPVFIYESVHRIEKTLWQLKDLGFDGKIFLAREISKMYEQKECAHIDTIIEKVKNGEIKLKGEFVLWIINKND